MPKVPGTPLEDAFGTERYGPLELLESTNALVASFYNSLSFAFAEISGRSYGGGVLELMPGEAGKILLPYTEAHEELLCQIDQMMRSKKSIDDILKLTDTIILQEGYGLSNKEVELANKIWKKLSYRRLNRAKSRKGK